MEIDLQSALAQSRSGQVLNSADDTGRSRRLPSESSIKLDSYPGFENVVHTVTVESARTLDRESAFETRDGDESRWTEDQTRWTEDQSVDITGAISRNSRV